MTYTTEVLADSPDVYYRLSETGSGPFVDVVGGHNAPPDGVIVSATSLIPSDADAAAAFDYSTTLTKAVSGYVLSQRPLTVEAWVSPLGLVGSSAAGYSIIVSCGVAGGWVAHYMDTAIWALTYQGVLTYQFTLSTHAAIGVTQHVVFVLQTGNTIDLYLNGSFQETKATGGLVATGNKLTVAGYETLASGRPKAIIDEVAIYKSALSAGRIAAHYAAGIASAQRSVAGWITKSGAL